MTERLTDVAYWDSVWDGLSVPQPLDPNNRALDNFMNLELHRFFQRIVRRIALTNRETVRLIELGCGGSIILPYFHREYGFKIAGLDYSQAGCDSCRAINAQADVPADIRQGDMFNAPPDMIGAFDIVFSAGLVEHFRPTRDVIEVLGRFCRPGGHLITLIPNLAGVIGPIQRLLNKPVYDLHVPLSVDDLVRAHRDGGFDVVDSGLIGTINLGILNFSGAASRVPLRIGQRLTSWTSKFVWTLRRLGMPDMPSRFLSPNIACVAKKRAVTDP